MDRGDSDNRYSHPCPPALGMDCQYDQEDGEGPAGKEPEFKRVQPLQRSDKHRCGLELPGIGYHGHLPAFRPGWTQIGSYRPDDPVQPHDLGFDPYLVERGCDPGRGGALCHSLEMGRESDAQDPARSLDFPDEGTTCNRNVGVTTYPDNNNC